MNFSWLVAMKATPAVIVVFVMGVCFAICMITVIKIMWAQNVNLKYQIGVMNTWMFSTDKQLKLNQLKTGNSQGDVMLDWDGIPKKEKAIIIKVIKSGKKFNEG